MELRMNVYPLSYIGINVRNLGRSVDFYRTLLDLSLLDVPGGSSAPRRAVLAAGPARLRLTEIGENVTDSGWTSDDLQKGFRHVGFKVNDIDARAERVREAGVKFHLEPFNATGGVRIAFFQDPDGVMLELVQGNINYHKVWNDKLLEAERQLPVPQLPRFDHVAVTVEDLDRTLQFYRESLGFDVIGQVFQDQDARGFVITYLKAGDTVLEIFSYRAPKLLSAWLPDEHQVGFRTAGFEVDDVATVLARLTAEGAIKVSVNGQGSRRLLTDPNGFPLKIGDA
jgi:catechol 2,3-dioxygenase-like lactoylglutathione lyase family enzyme